MNKKIRFIIATVPLLLLIFLAVLYYKSRRPEKHENQCLGSFTEFAYSVPQKNTLPLEKTLPQAPWKVEALLPVPSDDYTLVSVETTRSINGYSEVWLKKDTSFSISQGTTHEYMIYRPDTKTWETISAQIDNTEAYVQKLFVSKDGSVWGQNAWTAYSNPSGIPVLSKYNEKEEKFEVEKNIVSIPAAWRNSGGYDYWSKVLLDQSGTFWILANKDAIFSYNPVSQEVKRYAEIPDFLVSYTSLDPDHNIYITRQWDTTVFSIQDKEIWKFDHQTGDLKNLGTPPEPWPAYNNIVVDHSGKLVLGAVGWLSKNAAWHRIYPHPLTYFWNMKWNGDYRWYTPELILESSDGRLWYRKKLDDGGVDPVKWTVVGL